MMDLEEVMNQLESQGTEQNRKVYRNHGLHDPMFGVSYANLNKLCNQLGVNHPLGVALWETGNLDAQSLGALIMDPFYLEEDRIHEWVKGARSYSLVDLLADLVIQTPFARSRMQVWIKAKTEHVKRAGYSMLARFARCDHDSLTDAAFIRYLKRIEREIHQAPNRARQMMNIAVLDIGICNDVLHEAALATAKVIGPVDLDHGKTNCKTTDVVAKLGDARFVASARKRKNRRR